MARTSLDSARNLAQSELSPHLGRQWGVPVVGRCWGHRRAAVPPNEFASWCRVLRYLRQNYDEAQTYELCDANVLQLASNLKAIVPSDNADQALKVILTALVEKGRMSWLYAVPPAFVEALKLRDGQMAPFVMTRLEVRLKPNKKHRVAIQHGDISFETVQEGRITQVLPLSQVLETTFSHLRNTRDFDFPEQTWYCHRVPDIIRRLLLDIVDPLLSEPTFSRICKALGLVHSVKSEARKGWLCVIFLALIDEPLINEMCVGSAEDDVNLVKAAAASLQRHLQKIQNSFSVVRWNSQADTQSTKVAVGLQGFPADTEVFSLKGEPESMFVARLLGSGKAYAEFCGPLYQLNVRDTIGPRPSTLFTAAFWRKKGPLSDEQTLRFKFASTFLQMAGSSTSSLGPSSMTPNKPSSSPNRLVSLWLREPMAGQICQANQLEQHQDRHDYEASKRGRGSLYVLSWRGADGPSCEILCVLGCAKKHGLIGEEPF
ncbi:hypothetical protein EK21DRAFT_88563 [Setomelanomma holmii]|uniref:Uncharacterized protein n=1 Tax=Setomelanomma holmii TaxID=210430 RepID=A0A9P4LPG9_9PLEO|nr:hypothetical protein EK21DRAFT_88563 [Setomelanomma holmii]